MQRETFTFRSLILLPFLTATLLLVPLGASAAVDVDLTGTVLTIAFDDAASDQVTLAVFQDGYETNGAAEQSGTGTITQVVVTDAGAANLSGIYFTAFQQDLTGGLEVSGVTEAVVKETAQMSTAGGNVVIDATAVTVSADIVTGGGDLQITGNILLSANVNTAHETDSSLAGAQTFTGPITLQADVTLTTVSESYRASSSAGIELHGAVNGAYSLTLEAGPIDATQPIGGVTKLTSLTARSRSGCCPYDYFDHSYDQRFSGVNTVGGQHYFVRQMASGISLEGDYSAEEISVSGLDGYFGVDAVFAAETTVTATNGLHVETVSWEVASNLPGSQCAVDGVSISAIDDAVAETAQSGTGVSTSISLAGCTTDEQITLTLDMGDIPALPAVGAEIYHIEATDTWTLVSDAVVSGSAVTLVLGDGVLDTDPTQGEVEATFTSAVPADFSGEGPLFSIDLDANPDGTIVSAQGSNCFGTLAHAGDVNADGTADLIVGAFCHDSAKGAAYVVYGGQLYNQEVRIINTYGQSIEPSEGFQIATIKSTSDEFGYSVLGAADFNFDGHSDLVVGDPSSGSFDYGSLGVFFGPFSGDEIQNAPDITLGYSLSYAHFGEAIASGDLNGDGIDDLVISQPNSGVEDGRVYVIFGKADLDGSISMDNLGDAGITLTARTALSDDFSVATGRDINGDGIDDLVIGSHGVTVPYAENAAGRVSVIFGGASIAGGSLDTDLGDAGFHIDAVPEAELGHTVALSDINNDGLADILIGSVTGAYVVYGSNETDNIHTARLGDRGFHIRDVDDGQPGIRPYAVGSGGDINSDGLEDAFILSPRKLGLLLYGVGENEDPQQGVTIDNPDNRGFIINSVTFCCNGNGVKWASLPDATGDARWDLFFGGLDTSVSGGGRVSLLSGFTALEVAYPSAVQLNVGESLDVAPISVVSNGDEVYAVSPQLPEGLSLNTATGEISGIPEQAFSGGVTITLSDRMIARVGSASAVFNLVIEPVAPDPPVSVSAEAINGGVKAAWSAPPLDGGAAVTGYRATVQPGGQFCDATVTNCVISDLQNGVTYTVSVVATNAKGSSLPSDPSNAVSWIDEDADGVNDVADNCLGAANPLQENFDGDALGDLCDPDDDNDGLTDDEELALGTDPKNRDSDGDGWSDKEETEEGTDPLQASSQPESNSGLPIWLLYQATQ